ncbi:hypothetical protein PInf_007479 [Phytophthora infestans]|nr:hypothetical protein PInf_007479 [Phytophthora infestans]
MTVPSALGLDVKANMAKSAAVSGIEEELTERDDLLTNVVELFEYAEAARDDNKQEKAAK